MTVVRGVTRTVLVGRRRVYKVPGGQGLWCREFRTPAMHLVRGWLANRSEWKQRTRPDVMAPSFSLLHVVLVMPRADITYVDQSIAPTGIWDRYRGDEGKPSSWGFFGTRGHWLLIDFDRSWDSRSPHGLGIVGWLYNRHQEALARKWSALPSATETGPGGQPIPNETTA